MPLDRIYLTRHAIRLTWTLDLKTGTYHATYPSPTGIAVDPSLTSAGVTQSHELAEYIHSPAFEPKPCRIYSSPFYRCLLTIRPAVEALKKLQEREKRGGVDLDVRMENGLQDWFGASSSFSHPGPASPETLQTHFPTILPSKPRYKPHLHPPANGESIAQLHDRMATVLDAIIAQVDAEIEVYERENPEERNKSRAILVCAHAAPNIAIGRVLTGNMPDDSSTEDFKVFTAGLSTFVRRRGGGGEGSVTDADGVADEAVLSGKRVPQWRDGKGIRGGWDCIVNCDCSFLSGGEQRGWHFNGEENFDTMPGTTVGSDDPPPSSINPAVQCSPPKL